MSARKLHDAGYGDLVSVIPPGAEISGGSAVKPEQLGKVPGVRKKDGTWIGYPFTKKKIAPGTIDKTGANIGLLGNSYPALDIDVEDEALSKVLVKAAHKHFGVAPVRSSRGARKLLTYFTDAPFGRIAMTVEFKGQTHLVEMLGKGRQYVVEGTHPSGAEYAWDTPLWEAEVPTVTQEQVIGFFESLAQKLHDKGLPVEVIGSARQPHDAPPQEDLLAPGMDKLEALVAVLPNPESFGWDDYIKVAHAIRAAGGEEAKDLFLDWCEKWEGGANEPGLDEANWDGLKGPFRVGWTWLQEVAQDFGDYNAAQDLFEADLDPEDAPEPKAPDPTTYSDEWVVREHLIGHMRSLVRYVPGINNNGTWLSWQGHKWVEDKALLHERLIREQLMRVCADLRARAAAAPSKEAARAPRAAAMRLSNAGGVRSVVSMVKALVACNWPDFDRDEYVLNTPEGPVDLRTGIMSPPGGAFLRSTSVVPVSGPHPKWDRFLRDLTGNDAAFIRYLQKVVGYALTGDMTEKGLWFVWGSATDTGKSTFVNTISALFGNYTDSVDVSVFISRNARSSRPELARLPGVRLVTATEPSAGHSWDEKAIKAITGGDPIETRFLYGQPFTYHPQFKIMVMGNHEPSIRVLDEAMLRRLAIVPFNRKVPRDRQISKLAKILVEEEGPQILAWLVDGYRAWQSEGLQPPEAVQVKTAEYEEQEDMIAQWMEEECVFGDYEVTSRELYAAWAVWCRQNGEEPGGLKSLRKRILARDLPIRSVKLGARRLQGYRGMTLRSQNDPFQEETE